MTEEPPDLEPIDLAAEPTRETPTHSTSEGPTVEMPSPPAANTTWPPGWYSDPWTAGQYRYWTGQTWTGETNRWGPTNAGLGADPWPPVSAPVTTGYGLPTASEPAEAPKKSRRGPIVASVIALALLVAVSATVGYAIDSSSRSDNDTAGAAGPSTSTPGATTPGSTPSNNVPSRDPDRRVLGGLVVQQSDVGAQRTVLLIPNGNFTSQPTLDLCNGTFPSEKLRTARLQVAAVDTAGNTSLSTEAVLYRNPAASAQAFAELADVRAKCPDKAVPSPVGDPAAKTTFKAPPDTNWPRNPTVERQAYSFVSESNGKSFESVAVYLRRGRALMGVYFLRPAGAQATVAGERSMQGIVSVFEARMARLPAAVVNRR